jgi:molybdate transport system ATP-binding protein
LSVLDNLRYGQKRSAEKIVSLDQVVELLGIGHLLDRRPDRLSGGERQRVGIARALAVSPRLLLMDEPLAALDLARKREILPYLERLHDELDIPVLYVTHAPDEVARLADHLVMLDGGLVVAAGPLAEMLARIDLPLGLGEEREVVLDAVIGQRDPDWHLARMDFAGGSLWARDRDIPVGRHVRVRVPASGVSLALQPAGQSSIINSLPGQVEAIGDAEHPGLSLVKVRVGDVSILSRVTRRSVAGLQIEPGKAVWVQVKSAAVVE